MTIRRVVRLAGVLALCLAGAAIVGCSNSILRNTTEAGLETVLEGPLPTPTAARPPAPRY